MSNESLNSAIVAERLASSLADRGFVIATFVGLAVLLGIVRPLATAPAANSPASIQPQDAEVPAELKHETSMTPHKETIEDKKSLDSAEATEQASGPERAVERVTQEMATAVQQRQTIAVWLFDESHSLESRRELIANRFEHIYRQLGLNDNANAKNTLTTGIVGYGENVHVLVREPTSDLAELTKAVRTIKNDDSGKENVFAAVAQALDTYTPLKRTMDANLMFVIVTDERGDDFQMLEETIKQCKDEDARVYCIGNASTFGQDKGFVRFKWEYEDKQYEEDIPLDQGPETGAPENLLLPFWTNPRPDVHRMSAGFGPYALSRLCADTGGVFLIAEETTGEKWDSHIMQKYRPDYRPIAEYTQALQDNRAKQALVKAAQMALTEQIRIPQQVFSVTSENSLNEQITVAQKPLAVLDYFLLRLQAMLESGEKYRDKLDTDRWRASYDLAMGRVLAMRARALGYSAMLAEMKSHPRKFVNPESDRWRLEPSDTITADAKDRVVFDKALEYLKRVSKEHPGTPWALLANTELGNPLGWIWIEDHPLDVSSPNEDIRKGETP